MVGGFERTVQVKPCLQAWVFLDGFEMKSGVNMV